MTTSAMITLTASPEAPGATKQAHAYSAIPLELRQRPQWVCWKYGMRNNKPTKVPYQPTCPERMASVRNARHWSNFQTAVEVMQRQGFDGIGFVFTDHDPYCGMDLDHCIDNGQIAPWAQTIIAEAATYAEMSPSGRGVKLIGKAKLAGHGLKRMYGEIYDTARYFTITGKVLVGHTTITSCQDVAATLYRTLLAQSSEHDPQPSRRTRPATTYYRENHSEAAWDEARAHARMVVQNELHGNPYGLPRGVSEGSQTALALQGNTAALVQRWPYLAEQIYRADTTVDESMLRFIAGKGLRTYYGYSFPRWIAIMQHFFGRYLLTKYGGIKAAVQEELARIWAAVPPAKRGEYQLHAKPAESRARRPPGAPAGRRASNSAHLLTLLKEMNTDDLGTIAIPTAALAEQIGVTPRMIRYYLNDLQQMGTIRFWGGRGKGLRAIVLDPAVAPERQPEEEMKSAPIEGEGTGDHQTDCVPSEGAGASFPLDHESDGGSGTAAEPERSAAAEEPGYHEAPDLKSLVTFYLDYYTEPPREVRNKQTGEIREIAYIRTAARAWAYVKQQQPGRWQRAAVVRLYRALQEQRSVWSVERANVQAMDDTALLKAIKTRQKALARNIGKRREEFHRIRLSMAWEAWHKRGIAGIPAYLLLKAQPVPPLSPEEPARPVFGQRSQTEIVAPHAPPPPAVPSAGSTAPVQLVWYRAAQVVPGGPGTAEFDDDAEQRALQYAMERRWKTALLTAGTIRNVARSERVRAQVEALAAAL